MCSLYIFLFGLVSATHALLIHISDIHLDTKYTIGAPTSCLFQELGMTCCRLENFSSIEADGGATQWGSLNCDLNEYLLNSTLEFIKNKARAEMKISSTTLLITGDLASHHDFDVLNTLPTIQRVIDLLLLNLNQTETKVERADQAIQAIQVIPVLGNHDAWFVDQEWNPGSIFLHEIADLWKPWFDKWNSTEFDSNKLNKLKNSPAFVSFREFGYYSAIVNNQAWIVLNSLWYDANNLVTKTHIDPGYQYQWLLNELNFANTPVNLAMHIPPSTDTPTLNGILCKFQSKINLIFAGHTHHDHFRLLSCNSKHKDNNDSVTQILIAPSLQTSHHLPSVRIFQDQPLQPSRVSFDYEQYHLGVNSTIFERTYQFQSAYNVTNAVFLYDQLQIRGDNLQLFYSFYDPITSGYCDPNCQVNLLDDIIIINNTN